MKTSELSGSADNIIVIRTDDGDTKQAKKVVKSSSDEIEMMREHGQNDYIIRQLILKKKNDLLARINQFEKAADYDHVMPVNRVESEDGEDGISWTVSVEMPLWESLREYLDRTHPKPSEMRKIAISVAEDIKYLHESGITHGRIHPNNIFVNPYGKVCVGDFGEVRSLHIPCEYHAPEIADGFSYDQSVDIYSLGYMIKKDLYFSGCDMAVGMMCDTVSERRPVIDQVIKTLRGISDSSSSDKIIIPKDLDRTTFGWGDRELKEKKMALVSLAPHSFVIPIDMDTLTIGRGTDDQPVDAEVNVAQISRLHCKIEKRRSDYYIEDCGSKNGTYLNRKRLPKNQPVRFQTGDRVRLANVIFIVRNEEVI